MNNGESVFLIAIFVFIFVAWLAGGGAQNVGSLTQEDVFIGPGTILGSEENTLLPKKKWYEYLNLGSSTASTSSTSKNINLADASPYTGLVSLATEDEGLKATAPQKEYLILVASDRLEDPVVISGWKIQTARGKSATIPLGSGAPQMNVVNKAEPIALFAGEQAYVVTGQSPIGTSFKESVCTGYFGDLQEFTPVLTRSCPTAYDSWRAYASIENISDVACSNELRGLDRCEATSNLSSSVSSACEDFVERELSYTGCRTRYLKLDNYYEPTWRIYLRQPSELYTNTRDTLYLIDEKGKLVDTLSY